MITKTATALLYAIPEKKPAITKRIERQKAQPAYRQKWIKKMEFLHSVAAHEKAVILLHDTSANRFLYMSDKSKILGTITLRILQVKRVWTFLLATFTLSNAVQRF